MLWVSLRRCPVSPTVACMALLDRTLLMTPEGVTYDLRLAGLGSRFSAALVDLIIMAILMTVVGSRTGDELDGTIGTAIATILLFLLLFGYFAVFETLWRGRTPGKRMNGLRVVTEQGGPIGARRAAIRNLIRIIDWLPLAYVVGSVTIGTSPRAQRLGDLAAGTIVIVEPSKGGWLRRRRGGTAEAVPLNVAVPLNDMQLSELMTWDVSAVTREELGVVLQFLERRAVIEMTARQRLAGEFAKRLRPRVTGVPPQLGDERFLELLARAKQHRR